MTQPLIIAYRASRGLSARAELLELSQQGIVCLFIVYQLTSHRTRTTLLFILKIVVYN